MKLDIRYANTKMLVNIKVGETFLYDKRYFMVTDGRIGNHIKCVDLEHGVTCNISDEIRVIPVKLKVVLDEEKEHD